MFKNRQQFWSDRLSGAEKAERIFLLLMGASVILTGIDGLTDCFGIMRVIAEDAGVIPDSCARACNDGWFGNGITMNVNGTQEIFHLAGSPATDTWTENNKMLAALTHTLALPVTLLITKFSAYYFKNLNQNQHQQNDHQDSHSHRV